MSYKILQIGDADWSRFDIIPRVFEWSYVPGEHLQSLIHNQDVVAYDIVLIDLKQQMEGLLAISDWLPQGRVIYSNTCSPMTPPVKEMLIQKKAVLKELQQSEAFFKELLEMLQEGVAYETSFEMSEFSLSPRYFKQATFLGRYTVELSADFGDHYQKVGFSQVSRRIPAGQLVEIWPECSKEETLDLVYELTVFSADSDENNVIEKPVFEVGRGETPFVFGPYETDVIVYLAIYAKGHGKLSLRTITLRSSKSGQGYIVLGDDRLLDAYGGEVAYYFYPGDGSRELTVYFSNGKEVSTYEGLALAKQRQKPFLFFKDLRGEQGQFYLGDSVLQEQILQLIKSYQGKLGVSQDKVFVLGNHLAALPALYYGLQVNASTILVSDPLLFLTDVVQDNSRYNAGGELDIMDLLQKQGRQLTIEEVVSLEESIWDEIDGSQNQTTQLVVSYLALDDYEQDYYTQVLAALAENRETLMTVKVFNHFSRDAKESMQDWLYGNYMTRITAS